MKPQLYSIVILLLTRINYGQNISTQAAGTQLPVIHTNNTTSVAKTPDVTVTEAPDDYKTSAPENPKDNITHVTTTPKDNITHVTTTLKDNVTSVTMAPKDSTTSITKTFSEVNVSEIPTDKTTVFSEAPNSQAASTPSLAPNVTLVRTTKGFTVTTRSGGTPKATRSTSILIGKQTSNPIVPGKATTPRNNKVTAAVRKTTKSTTANRTSALPVPSLFAVVLLVVSVLRF